MDRKFGTDGITAPLKVIDNCIEERIGIERDLVKELLAATRGRQLRTRRPVMGYREPLPTINAGEV
jgi:hypothetical protein